MKSVFYYAVLFEDKKKSFNSKQKAMDFISECESKDINCTLFNCNRDFRGGWSWTCIYDTIENKKSKKVE